MRAADALCPVDQLPGWWIDSSLLFLLETATPGTSRELCVCPSQEEKNLNQVWRQRGHRFSYTSAGSRQLLCSANWKINEMFDKEEYELAKSLGTFCTWKLKTFFYWMQQWSLGIAPYKQEASPSLVFEVEQSPEYGGESLILSSSSSIYDIFLIWTGSKVKLPEVYQALNTSHLFKQNAPQKVVFPNTTITPERGRTAVSICRAKARPGCFNCFSSTVELENKATPGVSKDLKEMKQCFQLFIVLIILIVYVITIYLGSCLM